MCVLKFGFKLGTTFTETFKIIKKHNTFLSERAQQPCAQRKYLCYLSTVKGYNYTASVKAVSICTGSMILTKENQSTWRKTCPIATLSTTDCIWTTLESNLGLLSDSMATACLSYGIVIPEEGQFVPMWQTYRSIWHAWSCVSRVNFTRTKHKTTYLHILHVCEHMQEKRPGDTFPFLCHCPTHTHTHTHETHRNFLTMAWHVLQPPYSSDMTPPHFLFF